MEVSHNSKSKTTTWPSNSTPGYIKNQQTNKQTKTPKTLIGKDTCTPMFTAALFTISKTWNQSRHQSTDEWTKKRSDSLRPHGLWWWWSVPQLCPTLCDHMECSPPGSSVHGFSRQEYWSGLPFLPPGDLPFPYIKTRSPALQGDSVPLSHKGSPKERWYI